MSELTPVKWRLSGKPELGRNTYVEERVQRDGSPLYVVIDDFRGVLGKDGEWEWEPQPSSRTDGFVARTRFASVQEASAAFRQHESTITDRIITEQQEDDAA